MEINNKKSVFTKLKPFCIYSLTKPDFMEVTEWVNGEGVTVAINDSLGNRHFDLTYGQIDALKKCIKTLHKS
jgi:hypothetical protein